VLFWAVVVVPFIGIMIAIGATPQPSLVGWLITASGVYWAIASVKHWARTLPAVFGPAILNGFLILVDGHALNQPNVPAPRAQSLMMIGVMVFGTITTAPFTQRDLFWYEKLSAIGVWICFVVAFVGIDLRVKDGNSLSESP
jgi:FtsH-binding integral membrane protein